MPSRIVSTAVCIRHQVGSLVFGREQDEVGETFDHHGGQLPQVAVAALQAPLHELVDVTMQALGHLAPLFLNQSNAAHEEARNPNKPPLHSSNATRRM